MSGLRQLLDALRNLLTWWVTVAPWEQAIRVRLGKRVSLLGAGVHLRIPIADRFYLQSVRTRVATLPAQTLVTKDGKALTVAVTVRYRIADLLRLYETLHHAEGTIANIVLGAVGEFVVGNDLVGCHPERLSPAVAKAADLSRYGLDDVGVTVQTFASVRTFRFITGDGHAWGYGDPLETSLEMQSGADRVVSR